MRCIRPSRLFPATLLLLALGAACDDAADKPRVDAAQANKVGNVPGGVKPKDNPRGDAEPSDAAPESGSPMPAKAVENPTATQAAPELPAVAQADVDNAPRGGGEGPAYFAVRDRGLVQLLGPDGGTYALASSQLLKLTDPQHVKEVDLKLKGFVSLGYLALGANDRMALRSGIDQVMLVDEGTIWKAGTDFAANRVRGVGVDGRGRVWVNSDIGVAILGPGDAKTEWNSGSVLELAGKVEHIVAIGLGPELPDVGEAKTGGLKGTVLADGKGLPETEVELCPSPNMMFEASPCDDSPVKFAGKTDAGGAFVFANRRPQSTNRDSLSDPLHFSEVERLDGNLRGSRLR